MKKIPMSKKTARNIDYFFWAIWMVALFLIDWRIAVAFVVFDTMRAFELIQREIELNERELDMYQNIKKLIDDAAKDLSSK